jgi:glycosyltransferase involved in cell wall biosynthesis
MNNISVILEVYNEEARLENCLKSFSWADEIVVFVKESNDNTLKIAKKHATHVYEVDYCNASENVINNFRLHTFKEWCFCITASSQIDEFLVLDIINLTSDKNFKFDVIGLPYDMYVFNLTGKFSPWYNEYKFPLIRRSVLKISTILHQEISWDSDKVYKIDRNLTKGRFKHYTHKSPDEFFLKHIRYVKYEAIEYKYIYKKKAIQKALFNFIKSLAFVLIKRRTFFKGRNGFVLSIAYISYSIMLLVYVWHNEMQKNKDFNDKQI